MSEGTWALIGVLVGTIGTGFFNYLLQKRQFDHNKEMFSLQNKGLESPSGRDGGGRCRSVSRRPSLPRVRPAALPGTTTPTRRRAYTFSRRCRAAAV